MSVTVEQALAVGRSVVRDVSDCGPQKAVKRLVSQWTCEADRVAWMKQARLGAIVGSCPKSLGCVMSGLRSYFDFAHQVLKKKGCETKN